MAHPVGLAVQAGRADDLAVHPREILHIVGRTLLRAQIGFLRLHAERHALRPEAEVVRLSADDLQILQQRGAVLRPRAFDHKWYVFRFHPFVPLLLICSLKSQNVVSTLET